ncbi:hypothetical protein Pfo_007387 [Paulownia fortunei]|nr:hypothetical protein Pfo_007387 [Paulownia fortunei]
MFFCPFVIILENKKNLQGQTMAACGSLEHIFEKPLPENPTFLESLSPWKHIKSMKTIDDSSFTELFGELHFKENRVHSPHETSPPSSSPFLQSSPSSSLSSNSPSASPGIDIPKRDNNESSSVHQEKNQSSTSSYYPSSQKKQYKHSDSFSSMNSESLSLCTEGLGFESFDDVEDLVKTDVCNNEWQHQDERKSFTRNTHTENHRGESKRSRTSRGPFPPPISCIGRSGKPWVCFKSYRQDGRFILKEIRIPTQEFLHACRENGRLKLQFIHSDDEILEEDEDNIEEQNEDTGNNDDDKQEHPRNEREGRNGDQIVETRDCNIVQGSS